jgi:hypothetical protein
LLAVAEEAIEVTTEALEAVKQAVMELIYQIITIQKVLVPVELKLQVEQVEILEYLGVVQIRGQMEKMLAVAVVAAGMVVEVVKTIHLQVVAVLDT